MARPKYKIQNRDDASYAISYLFRKMEDENRFFFPYSGNDNSWSKNNDAEQELKKAVDDPCAVNTWCEKHLNKKQWSQLKNSIRIARLRQHRKHNYSKSIKRVDLSVTAHNYLSILSKSNGISHSDVIEKYLKRHAQKIIKEQREREEFEKKQAKLPEIETKT